MLLRSAFGATILMFCSTSTALAVCDVNYRRELLTIRAKQINLGTFADGAQPVLAGVQLGTVSRANNVRMVRKGKALKY